MACWLAFEHAISGGLNKAVDRVLVLRADSDLSLAGHFVPPPYFATGNRRSRDPHEL